MHHRKNKMHKFNKANYQQRQDTIKIKIFFKQKILPTMRALQSQAKNYKILVYKTNYIINKTL